jgi:hypothetical protein
MTIGERLSPILEEIEMKLWQHEAIEATPMKFTTDGFRSAIKIFSTALIDKAWELQERENLDFEDRGNMMQKCGEEIRRIVKTFADIDTQTLYQDLLNADSRPE